MRVPQVSARVEAEATGADEVSAHDPNDVARLPTSIGMTRVAASTRAAG